MGIKSEAYSGDILPLVTAAHELKGPLALVRQLSLLLDDEQGLTINERKEIARKIRLTTERSLRLTSDLTKISRLEDAMFEFEPINPVQVCREIASELKPLMDAHNRTINIFARRRHPLLLVANRDLLRRVVMNFTDNALHYGSPDSSIEMAIRTLNRGNIVRLSVRDYGPALRKNVKRNLKRGSDTVNQVSGRPDSSGLGLYLSGKFAQVMNGRIGVINHRDGVTFYVDLKASTQMSLL